MTTLYGYLNELDEKRGKLTFTIIPGGELENGKTDPTRENLQKYIRRDDIDLLPYTFEHGVPNIFYINSKYGITSDMRPLISRQVKVVVEPADYTIKTTYGDKKYLRGRRLNLVDFSPVTTI